MLEFLSMLVANGIPVRFRDLMASISGMPLAN